MAGTSTRGLPWSWDEARFLCLREARRVLKDRQEAEDAAQEAVLRAWRASERSAVVGSPQAWLRTIAANEARRRWSRRPRAEAVSDVVDQAETAVSDDGLGAVVCEQMLAPLPERDRVLVHMRVLDDLSYGEIAAAAGIPEATVKTRIHRSLARLRRLLSNEALG